jgi:hypothetical protein
MIVTAPPSGAPGKRGYRNQARIAAARTALIGSATPETILTKRYTTKVLANR